MSRKTPAFILEDSRYMSKGRPIRAYKRQRRRNRFDVELSINEATSASDPEKYHLEVSTWVVVTMVNTEQQ